MNDNEFQEMMHNNWNSQMDMLGYNPDGTQKSKQTDSKRTRIITFDSVRVSLPMKDGETKEEIEDRFIEAVDSIGEGVVMSFKTSIEEYDDEV